jgi:hypothetical protein
LIVGVEGSVPFNTNSFLTREKNTQCSCYFQDGFLMRGTFVSLTQLNRKFEANGTYVLLETPKLQEVIVSKTNSILT